MQKSSLDREGSDKDITKVMLNEMPSSQMTKMCHDSIKVVIKPKKQYIQKDKLGRVVANLLARDSGELQAHNTAPSKSPPLIMRGSNARRSSHESQQT